MPEFSAEVAPEYIEMWLAGGERLYRSPSLGELDLPRFAGTKTEPRVRNLALPDGRAGRAIGAEFDIEQYTADPEAPEAVRARVVLVLARGRAGLDRALAMLLGGTAVGILLPRAEGSSARVVSRGLRPPDDPLATFPPSTILVGDRFPSRRFPPVARWPRATTRC
jgi:hypothetical protein